MTDRDVFEQRLEAAVREYVEGAPTDIDAAAFTHALATNVQRRRLVPTGLWSRHPVQLARALAVPALVVAVIGFGLFGSGAWRGVAGPGAQSNAASPTPTVAAPTVAPLPVTITSVMSVTAPLRPNVGTFEATGSAADQGVVCRKGLVDDLTVVDMSPLQNGRDVDAALDKRFTCDDGSGTFTLRLSIHVSAGTNAETISWVALSGTGAYERVRGGGSGSTVAGPASSQATNTYVGFLGR